MNFKYKIKKTFLLLFLLDSCFFNLIHLSFAASADLVPKSTLVKKGSLLKFADTLREFVGDRLPVKKKAKAIDIDVLETLLKQKPEDIKLFNLENIFKSIGMLDSVGLIDKFFEASYEKLMQYINSFGGQSKLLLAPELVEQKPVFKADVLIFFINKFFYEYSNISALIEMSDEFQETEKERLCRKLTEYDTCLKGIYNFFDKNRQLYNLYKAVYFSDDICDLRTIFLSTNNTSVMEKLSKNACCQATLLHRLENAQAEFEKFKKEQICKNECFSGLNGINLDHILLPKFFDDKPSVSGFHLDLLYRQKCNQCECCISEDFERYPIVCSPITLMTVEMIERYKLINGENKFSIDEKSFFPCNWQLNDLFEVVYELYCDICHDQKMSNMLDYPYASVVYTKYIEKYKFPVRIVVRNDSMCPGILRKNVVTIFPISSVPNDVAKIMEYRENRRSIRLSYYPMRFNYKTFDFEYGKSVCKFIPRNLSRLLEKFSKKDDVGWIEQFIRLGISGYEGNTFLHLAVIKQNIKVVEYLLNSGLFSSYSKNDLGKIIKENALVECYNSDHKTPYMLALEKETCMPDGHKIAEMFKPLILPNDEVNLSTAENIEKLATEIEYLDRKINAEDEATAQYTEPLISNNKTLKTDIKDLEEEQKKLQETLSQLKKSNDLKYSTETDDNIVKNMAQHKVNETMILEKKKTIQGNLERIFELKKKRSDLRKEKFEKEKLVDELKKKVGLSSQNAPKPQAVVQESKEISISDDSSSAVEPSFA